MGGLVKPNKVMSKNNWKERLIFEETELRERLEKLTDAISNGLVPEDQIPILRAQHEAMNTYHWILRFRLKERKDLKFGFGAALELLKTGFMVSRVGWWADKRYFVFKQVPAQIGLHIVPNMQSLPQAVKDEFIKRQEQSEGDHDMDFAEIKYSDQLAIVDNKNNIKAYTPSVEDVLAEDWYIV